MEWERGRVFEQAAGILFYNIVNAEKHALYAIATYYITTYLFNRIEHVTLKEGKKVRPIPLNTVDLLKVASQQLHIGPGLTMQIAERLYVLLFLSLFASLILTL